MEPVALAVAVDHAQRDEQHDDGAYHAAPASLPAEFARTLGGREAGATPRSKQQRHARTGQPDGRQTRAKAHEEDDQPKGEERAVTVEGSRDTLRIRQADLTPQLFAPP